MTAQAVQTQRSELPVSIITTIYWKGVPTEMFIVYLGIFHDHDLFIRKSPHIVTYSPTSLTRPISCIFCRFRRSPRSDKLLAGFVLNANSTTFGSFPEDTSLNAMAVSTSAVSNSRIVKTLQNEAIVSGLIRTNYWRNNERGSSL